MTVQMWISILSALLGGAGAVFGIMRGKRQEDRSDRGDLDNRIDERIRLSVGVTLAEIKADLSALRSLLPGDLSGRIHSAEQTVQKQQKDLDEVFQRLRSLEGVCARQGHSS